ncbi:MAG: hypothetical protein J6B36_09080 [Muribaculaceae bacterium]|nr:hypothetical protein [Muribaculaceae bacterium]
MAVVLLQTFTVDAAEDITSNMVIAVFLFILFFVTVTTTYDLGGGWFLKITTGVGFGGALIGSFIIISFSYVVLNWIAENIALATGLLLTFYVINQIIETVKYASELPKFFTITGIFCILIFAVETVCGFLGMPAVFFGLVYDGDFGMLQFLGMALTVIFTFVNIIARATQASYVEG